MDGIDRIDGVGGVDLAAWHGTGSGPAGVGAATAVVFPAMPGDLQCPQGLTLQKRRKKGFTRIRRQCDLDPRLPVTLSAPPSLPRLPAALCLPGPVLAALLALALVLWAGLGWSPVPASLGDEALPGVSVSSLSERAGAAAEPVRVAWADAEREHAGADLVLVPLTILVPAIVAAFPLALATPWPARATPPPHRPPRQA